MSHSNSMHREPPARTPKAPPWPFPASPLPYPLAPPIERPVRSPKPPLPDTPALF